MSDLEVITTSQCIVQDRQETYRFGGENPT